VLLIASRARGELQSRSRDQERLSGEFEVRAFAGP